MESGSISRFAEPLDIGGERKAEVEDIPRGFWLNKRRLERPSAQLGKAVGGDRFG